MARLYGRRLADYTRADFEQLEERVETRALNRHLTETYDDEPDDNGRPEW